MFISGCALSALAHYDAAFDTSPLPSTSSLLNTDLTASISPSSAAFAKVFFLILRGAGPDVIGLPATQAISGTSGSSDGVSERVPDWLAARLTVAHLSRQKRCVETFVRGGCIHT